MKPLSSLNSRYKRRSLCRYALRVATVSTGLTALGLANLTWANDGGPDVSSTPVAASTAGSMDYFGMKPPGEQAALFAPHLVSLPQRFEARIAFSRDMQECYLTETDATFSHPKLLVAHRGKNRWTEFTGISFGTKFQFCHEPFLSRDNQKLYFTADGDSATPGNIRDLWVAERKGTDWGEPTRLPAPINSDAAEFYFAQSSDGTIVFASNRPGGQGDFDLYYIETDGNGFRHAVNFGPPLNTAGPEYDPCPSPDGQYIIFASARTGPHLDLYVSFRDGKTWTAPTPLKGNVNTPANEYAPVISPDGQYLFFVRHDGKQSDIYWISTAQFRRDNRSADPKE